ncbi:tetratricopeptide repeat protein [Actinorhabdospora filicis]|uniref:tetratricopeptide repeat protein n=1 Tax=Actinorhabdospora filicis TaxID=1785913 RepID=UPI002553FAC2|nr:tetratricopeptide repeat protein [Actinorhabdospora filicis]
MNTVSGSIVIGAVVQGQTVHVTLPAKVPTALGGLPRAAGVFTGRSSDLDALLGMLAPNGPGGRLLVSAVAGMAGVGKTELVVQAAHHALRQGWFGGGVLFVDLAGYDPERRRSPADALGGWLGALGVPGEHIPASQDDRARLWRTIIAAHAAGDKPILVVVDNAADTGQVTPLLPGEESIPVLVTSRHVLDLDAHVHRLDVLDTEPAITLITELIALRCGPGDARLHDAAHRGGFVELAGLCAGLPLALRIIAALLADRPHLTPAALAARLRDEHGRLDQLVRRETSGDVAVRAAFDLSYQRLPPAQARMFRLLPANPGPTIATTAAAHLAGIPEAQAEALLADLHRAHLVEEPALGRWRLHDLLRLHAGVQAPDPADPGEAATAHQRLLDHYLTTTKTADTHMAILTPHQRPDTFRDRNHALAWLDAEAANLTAATQHAADNGDHHTTTAFTFALTRYLHHRRRFNDAITLTRHALAATHALGNRRGQGAALSNLGLALQEVRRFDEAITSHEAGLAIRRELGDHHSEGTALNNLGLALREVRRFDEAITSHQQAVEIYQDLGDRDGEGQALNNLGLALREVRRFDEAITSYQHAVEIYQDLGDRHGEGAALNNLGLALREVRRFDEAISSHEGGLAICRELGDRHGEGMALNNLGAALQVVRRFNEAITSHEAGLAICRELGDRHGEGQALNNLGAALQAVRRFNEAITSHQHAAEIYQDLGDRHGEGTALNNLGNALRAVRRFDEAITSYQQAVENYQDLGDRHREGQALNNLGLALRAVRRFDEAITSHEGGLAICRELGDRHGEGIALNNLGLALREVRRFDEAITSYQQAVEIYQDLGDRHREGQALNNLGLALRAVGRDGEARQCWAEALRAFAETGDGWSIARLEEFLAWLGAPGQ